YGLSDYDAGVLTSTRALADYFESVVRAGASHKAAANWIQSELLAVLKESGREIADSPVSAEALAELIRLVEDGTLSGKMGKTVFQKMVAGGGAPREIIAAEGLAQVKDSGEIERLCRAVLEENRDKVEQYKKGKMALFAFFVGQVMKASRGQANPPQVNETLKKLLES
ncbi:MAG: Asp-tRNA(Asn)/Glu-tRNA(Gln) amidotransferase subunit GatB, partial [Candidatus Acidiferrales bacterium]